MTVAAHFYVCDTCGALAYVTEEPIPDDGTFACNKCGSVALWDFSRLDKALQHSHAIYERRLSA